jgi:RNA polymerase sigma-70 factor (ECF subfamily)
VDGDPIAQRYRELKLLARRFLQREQAGHTLQPTALVHEAWLRLARQRRQVAGPELLGAAAGAMRLVLVDHARRRSRAKRGGEATRIALDDATEPRKDEGVDVLAIDDALRGLAAVDPELAHLVELRCFAGLDEEEIAARLHHSSRTIRRRWRVAKMFLARALGDAAGADA